MKVILLRHGTRDFTLGDVPLNQEGQEEALQISKNSSFQNIKTIVCSPKKRALMTIEPLAKKLDLKIITQESLDQMRSGESEASFITRVRLFLESLEKQQWPSPLVICSHSDWLSVALKTVPSNAVDLKYHMFQCAEWLEFEVDDGIWLRS